MYEQRWQDTPSGAAVAVKVILVGAGETSNPTRLNTLATDSLEKKVKVFLATMMKVESIVIKIKVLLATIKKVNVFLATIIKVNVLLATIIKVKVL